MRKTLITALLCMTARASVGQVTINIDMADKGIAVSPTLNGIFYEDINHSADGGLYAELIRNRSFEEINDWSRFRPQREPNFDDDTDTPP
ncbi:MAG: hypothetical protein LUC44_03855 [Prevotellaceae bacterium]|nr:hypothetical protein [Prevotellaceae bacterium]